MSMDQKSDKGVGVGEDKAAGKGAGLETLIFPQADSEYGAAAFPQDATQAPPPPSQDNSAASGTSSDCATSRGDDCAVSRGDDATGASGGAAAVASDDDEPGCRVHGGDDFVAYCETCDCLVCLDCLTGMQKEHGTHYTIRIKELLKNPDIFSDTLKSLNKLYEDKEEYAETLEQASTDVKEGHQAQVQNIRDAEKKAVAKLRQALDSEVAKLKADCDRQEARIKEVAQKAVDKVEEHEKQQASRLEAEHEQVQASLPPLSSLTAALDQDPNRDTLPAIVEANKKGKSVLQVEGNLQPMLDVETSADDADCSDIQQLTELTLRVVPSPLESASSQVQTEQEVSVILPGDLPDVRKRILSLVPSDLDDHNGGAEKRGSAVMDRSYHMSCVKFGSCETSVYPGPYKEPDATKSLTLNHDITFINPEDAAALSSMLGGKVTLKMVAYRGNWCLTNNDDDVVSINAHMYDDTGKYHINRTGKVLSAAGGLPPSAKIGDALEDFLGWRPSGLKEKDSDMVVDMNLTVKEWRDTFQSRDLTVLR